MFTTQVNPSVLTGNFADLPTPIGFEEGTEYNAIDTAQTFHTAIVAGVMSWVLSSVPTPPLVLPINEIAFGTGGGVTSDSRLTFDPTASQFIVRDGPNTVVFEVNAPSGIGPRDVFVLDDFGLNVFAVHAKSSDRTIVFGNPAGARLVYDSIANKLAAFSAAGVKRWELNASTGAPLTFATLAAANASLAGVANGQQAFIGDVRKPLEPALGGSGASCVYYLTGAGAPAWFTMDNLIATV